MTNDLVPQNGANLPAVPQNNSLDFDTLQRVAKMMAASGYFPDASDIAKAGVKIMAGQEFGIGAFASMQGIDIIKGKPSLGANLILSLIDMHPDYDYEVGENSDTLCEITIYRKDKKRGTASYSIEDAKRAGLLGKDNWRKYPSDMLFARAVSRARRRFAPGLSRGANIYVSDELEDINYAPQPVQIETGEIIEAEPVAAKPRPVPQPVPQKIAVPQTQAAKPSESGGFVVGIAREDLAKVTEPTVGSVVNAMVATGLYRARKHAINYIKKHIDLPAAYYNGDTLLLDNRVKRDSAQDMLTKAINHELKKKANEEEE